MKTHKMLGIAVTWRRAAVALLLLMAFIALATYAPSRVQVQPATGPVPLRGVGFDSWAGVLGVKETEIEASIIATASGGLWESTGVGMQLFFIRSGVPRGDECRLGMGTNSGRLDHSFFCYRMNARVALGRAYTKQGSFAFLGSGTSGGSVGPTHAPASPQKSKEVMSGTWCGRGEKSSTSKEAKNLSYLQACRWRNSATRTRGESTWW